MLIDPRNGADFDSPRVGRPVRWLVLASSPRTGSTLLARLLGQTGQVGHPKEYLNPTQLRDWEVRLGEGLSKFRHRLLSGPAVALVGRRRWSLAHRRAHLDRVAARRAGPTGWMVLKVHHHHWERFIGMDADLLGEVRWVRIRREDRLGQAISWARARQTGRWARHQGGWAPAVYRRGAIDRALARIEAAERGWDRIIGEEPCIDVVYEALINDPDRVVAEIMEQIGGSPPGPVDLELGRQADAISERWRARYLRGG